EALFDLVETKIRNLENSFAERLSADAYGSARVGGTDSAPVFSQTQLLGLDDLISDSVAVGGVDPASTPAWKSYMNVDQAWNPENLHHDLRVLVRKTNRGLENHKSFIVCG